MELFCQPTVSGTALHPHQISSKVEAAGRPGEQQAPPQDLTVAPTGLLTVVSQVETPSAILQLASKDAIQDRHSGDGCATVLSSGGTSARVDDAWQSCRDTLDSLSWVNQPTILY